jgi:hypothetical protein
MTKRVPPSTLCNLQMPPLKRQNTIVGDDNGKNIFNTPTGTDIEKKVASPSPSPISKL